MTVADFTSDLNRLRFPAELEAQFHDDHYQKSIPVTRLALGLGAALVLLFGLLDIWVAPTAYQTFWAIRLFVITPAIGLTFALTFQP